MTDKKRRERSAHLVVVSLRDLICSGLFTLDGNTIKVSRRWANEIGLVNYKEVVEVDEDTDDDEPVSKRGTKEEMSAVTLLDS